MLTELREKSQSFLIFVLFGMLIFVFIFFFGPQAQGLQAGGQQASASGMAAKVRGQEVSMREVDMLLRRFRSTADASADKMPELRRQGALQLVDQVLLEQRARKMGMAVSREEVLRYVTSNRNPDYNDFLDYKGNFDEKKFNAQIAQGFGVTSDMYLKVKEREMLINRYLNFLASQVKVADAEVRSAFDEEKRTWNLEFIEFKGTDHKPAQGLDAAAGIAYAASHADEVKAYYEKNKRQYVREKEVRVRRILVKLSKDADDAKRAAAKAKIDKLYAEAKADGADFAAIAKASSEDYFAKNGGDMNWKSKQNTSADDYAVFAALNTGDISEIKTSDVGLWFVKADDVKPALNQTQAQVSNDIGLILAQQAAERDAAKKVAQVALDAAKGGKSLADAYYAAVPYVPPAPKAPALDAANPEKAPEDGKAPEEKPAKVERPDPVKITGAFSARRGNPNRIPGIGESALVAQKLANLTDKAPLIDSLIEVDGRIIVARLKERVEPSDDDFAKERDALTQRLRSRRANQLFGNWPRVIYGSVTQREMLRKFAGSALLSSLPSVDGDAIRLDSALRAPASAASDAPASKASK